MGHDWESISDVPVLRLPRSADGREDFASRAKARHRVDVEKELRPF
jgi:hypothetical protein